MTEQTFEMASVDAETLSLVAASATEFAKPDAQRTRRVRDTSLAFDVAAWRAMAGQGWLAAMLPEALGGTALGLRAVVLIAERLGYACHTEPYVPVAVLAARCLLGCPQGTARDACLVDLGRGDKLVTVAWQSTRGEFAIDATEVIGHADGDAIRLDGHARFVAAPQADLFIVAARLDGAIVLALAPRDSLGLAITSEPRADGTASGSLAFDGLRIAPQAILARGATASAALADALDAAVLATAAELVGLIDRSLDLTLGYLGVRKQFGQPIGAFQVLQHRAVDMWMQKQLASAALKSATAVLADPASTRIAREAAASSAKARASQAALFVAGQAVQLHGAIGFTDEYELGVHVNRSIVLAAELGNAAVHRRRYGERVTVQER